MLSTMVNWLFGSSGLTPHGLCLLWEPDLIWTYVLSDAAIGLAYFTIPLALAIVAQRRRDLVFRPVFWLFAAFILLCGAGHWLDVVTLWVPAYGLEALFKVVTAGVSAATAVALWQLLPRALAMPSSVQLQAADIALRESEERHRASFEHSPVPLHTLDANGIILGVSDSWLDLFGYSRSEVLGRNLTAFQAPNSGAWPEADRATLLAAGEVRDLERRFLRRDGEIIDALVSARLEYRGTVPWIICVLIDITARRRAEADLRTSEAHLRQAQKMEAIGRLTGGIAHDFNNMLTAVVGNLELIRSRAPDSGPDLERFAGDALDAAKKAAGLTAQLLSFSRRQELNPKPLDPAEVVEGLRSLLTRIAGDRITLRIVAAAETGSCLADRNQLESAILNLVINARDALAGAGRILVSLGPIRIARGAEGGLAAGDFVRIVVKDNGSGMPESVRSRAFEPFFSTKPPGEGTGLGLAQIYGFARQSGGAAVIDSTPGTGTEVAILLPRLDATVVPDLCDVIVETPLACGESVLLVEDDAAVRATLAAILDDLGYCVREAVDADAALTVLAETSVDVVLTDLSMPGELDGFELATRIRIRRPEMPVVLMSGHLNLLEDREMPEGLLFVQKPCSRLQVATVLRQALSAVSPLDRHDLLPRPQNEISVIQGGR